MTVTTERPATSRRVPDKASDVLRASSHPLDALFKPHSVAVIGATEKKGSVGRTVLWNMISSPFGGTVLPVNPNRSNVLGIRAYPSLSEIDQDVELAVIVTPAPTVPDLVAECAAKGVKGIVVISAGFRETGPAGEALEQRILAQAREARIRVIGPNCLGIMNPVSGLNATFAAGMAAPGTVGFVSQSGALLTAVLDWSAKEGVGFSSVVSLGSMLDVGWGDVIYYLGDDPHTQSILIYMESIGDARAFLSAAREVALTKPIIVIKPGRTAEAAKAAASHTGSLTGSDEVLDAAFRRVGVLRVEGIADLFGIAEVLAKQPRPNGPNLTIVTNAGGPAVLATDALITGGGQLTKLSDKTMGALDAVLPPTWSHNNPIDIIGDAPPERYAKALEIAAADSAADGMLLILAPQGMTDPAVTATQLLPYAHIAGKPVLASWMGGPSIAEGSACCAGRRADVRLSGHGGAHVQLPLALVRGDAPALRNAGPGRRRRQRDRPRASGADHRVGSAVRPDDPDRGRVQGCPGRLRHPDHRDAGGPDSRRRSRCRARPRLPGRGQALQPHDHAQDRRRRRAAQPD